MLPRLLQRRTIWWPTWPGWFVLVLVFCAPLLLWVWLGESFLSLTDRQPAEALVVEGWIGATGVRAAKAEFAQAGYAHIIATSGLTGERWDARRWSHAIEAEEQFLRMGVPRDRVILAMPRETEAQRTFESAVAVRAALQAKGLHPKAITVFTRGVHARRSRLVFARVLGPETKVGVIAWFPPGYESERWWRSSDRTDDLIKESAGYWLELLFNSGRTSNSPPSPKP